MTDDTFEQLTKSTKELLFEIDETIYEQDIVTFNEKIAEFIDHGNQLVGMYNYIGANLEKLSTTYDAKVSDFFNKLFAFIGISVIAGVGSVFLFGNQSYTFQLLLSLAMSYVFVIYFNKFRKQGRSIKKAAIPIYNLKLQQQVLLENIQMITKFNNQIVPICEEWLNEDVVEYINSMNTNLRIYHKNINQNDNMYMM